jgi:hypothetical protein
MQDLLTKLVLCFNRKPSAEYVASWLKRMKCYDRQDVETAVEHLKDTENDLPSISKCLTITDSIAYNRKSRIDTQMRIQERQEARRFWSGDVSNDEYGKRCLENIRDAMAGTITRGEFVARAESMGINMDDYKQYTAGLDMSAKVGSHVKCEAACSTK